MAKAKFERTKPHVNVEHRACRSRQDDIDVAITRYCHSRAGDLQGV